MAASIIDSNAGYTQIAERERVGLPGNGGYLVALRERAADDGLSYMPGGPQNQYAHRIRPRGDSMTPLNPFAAINLNGDGTMRGVTLALAADCVRNFLPAGLELGPQDVTPSGTHPVILFFHDMFRAQMSIPTLLPNMTYHEHSVGVPFSYLSSSSITPGIPGPYYFMPKLFLDNFLATIGGLLFWGFPKEMASVTVMAERYTVTSLTGQRLTSLAWAQGEDSDYRPIAEYGNFEPVRQMLSQPIISMMPASIGPFFILSDFDKAWDVATIRPLRTALEMEVEYVPGFTARRYPQSGWSPGIDSSVLGSYELRAPWRLSLPYPPLLSFRR
jgi:acetoacetate decarboxylase